MAAASWGEGDDTVAEATRQRRKTAWLNGNGPEQPSSLEPAPWMSPPVGGVYVAKGSTRDPWRSRCAWRRAPSRSDAQGQGRPVRGSYSPVVSPIVGAGAV